jgi:hypothetical protein
VTVPALKSTSAHVSARISLLRRPANVNQPHRAEPIARRRARAAWRGRPR